MKPFEYFVPRTLDEACGLIARIEGDVRLLAGGTDVLVEIRKPSSPTPTSVVDVSRIAALKGIAESGDSIVVGPLTTHTEICQSDLIGRCAPILRAAASTIGSVQIRNRGTVGGNIMNAAACADTVPPLIALDARLKLVSLAGEREIMLSEFFAKPYVTAARKDEILTEIRFQKPGPGFRSSFVKLGRRNAMSISRLSVAVVAELDDAGAIRDARIVPGAVFPTWRRVKGAESALIGQVPSKDLFEEAGNKVSEEMMTHVGRRWSTEYKEPVIAVLVRRALETCFYGREVS